MTDRGPSKTKALRDKSMWSTNEKNRLLHAVKYMVNDTTSCKLVKSFIKWENIKIDGKSTEECKTMYQTLTEKVRKYRTIKEVIDDALSVANRPRKLTARKINFSTKDGAEEQLEERKILAVKKRRGRPSAHSKSTLKCPGMPKRPLTAFSLFMKDRSKEYPLIKGYTSIRLFATEWNELPEDRKKMYRNKYLIRYKTYKEKVTILRQQHFDEPSTTFKQSKAKQTKRVLQAGHAKKTKKKTSVSTGGLDSTHDIKVELPDPQYDLIVISDSDSDDNDDSERSSENLAPVKRESESHADPGIPQKKGKIVALSQTVSTHTDSRNPPEMPQCDTGPQNPITPAQNNEQHMDPVLPQNKRMHETISETYIVPAQNDALDEAILPSMRTPTRTNDLALRVTERTAELLEQNNVIDFNASVGVVENKYEQVLTALRRLKDKQEVCKESNLDPGLINEQLSKIGELVENVSVLLETVSPEVNNNNEVHSSPSHASIYRRKDKSVPSKQPAEGMGVQSPKAQWVRLTVRDSDTKKGVNIANKDCVSK